MAKKTKVPEGFGGWLLLPIVGICIGTISHLFFAIDVTSSLDSYSIGIILTTYLMTFLLAYTSFLIFSKRRQAPIFYIITVWAGVVCAFINLLIVGQYIDYDKAEAGLDILASLVGATIWSLYFTFSRQVKKTFVN